MYYHSVISSPQFCNLPCKSFSLEKLAGQSIILLVFDQGLRVSDNRHVVLQLVNTYKLV